MSKQVPSAPTENKPAAVPTKKQHFPDTLRSKRAWGFLAVLLFLIGVGTTVPVGKIPFLRGLVMAMGYSQEDTQHLSLFKALFTWSENRKTVPGEKPAPDEVAVFDQAEAAARRARGQDTTTQNGLIDFNTVNNQLRRQGKGVEQMTGSAGVTDPEDPSRARVTLNPQNASTATDANQEQVGDVYFGADSNISPRDKKDGYNSVNSLKRASNANQIAGAGTNRSGWLLQMIDKAFESDSELNDLQEGLNASHLASGLGSLKSVGTTKGQRDAYWAWLMSRAARRTPNVILKKTLAATGFDGAEIPRTVFNEFGFGGVAINVEDLQLDINLAEDFLEKDQKCKDFITVYKPDEKYIEAYKSIQGGVDGLKTAFTEMNCANVETQLVKVKTQASAIKTGCADIKQVYTGMGSACHVTLKPDSYGCEGRGEENIVESFQIYCQKESEPCEETSGECAADKLTINDALKDPDSGVAIGGTSGQDITAWVDRYYKDAKTEELSSEYLPDPNWDNVFRSFGIDEL